MRLLAGFILFGVLAASTGCRQSEEAILAELRAQMLQRCNRDIAPTTSALPGFDSAGYCNCITDRAMGQRNAAELKTVFEDRARMTAEGRQAATECLARQSDAVRQAVAVAPAPTPSVEEDVPAKAAPRPEPRPEPRPPAPAPAREEPAAERAPPRATPAPPRPEPEPAVEDEDEEAADPA